MLLVCAGPLVPGPVSAQSSNWVITPTVAVEGTYTDNVDLSANKKSDFITLLNPGITLDGKSSRASASLNYQWQVYNHANNSALDNSQRSLAANGKLELVDKWLFVEASHNIAQSTVSAFGTQSVGNELSNANRTETAAFSVSPYIQGHLGSVADYLLRYTGTTTRSDSGALSGASTTTRSWAGRLSGATPLVPLSWSLNAANQVVSQNTAIDTHSSSVTGTLTYQIDPQVRLLARAGRESDNYSSTVQEKRSTSGVGLDWAPTERTKVSLTKDRNAAGNAHGVDFSHHTGVTAWKFSDTRSIVVPTPQMALASAGTYYDLLYQLTPSSLSPAQRAAQANQLLLLSGIPANAQIYIPLMTSQVYVQRRQQASVALIGANNTVTLGVDRSNSENLGTVSGLADDFATNSNIRQAGFNASWAHKVTPDTSLTLNGSVSRNTGDSTKTSLKSMALLLATKLGANTSASLTLRQSHFDGGTTATGYDEHALIGAVQFRF